MANSSGATSGFKPKVVLSHAMFQLLLENTKKLQSLLEQKEDKPTESSAVEMSGSGNDLPPNPPAIIKVSTEPLPEAMPIVDKLIDDDQGAPAEASSSTSKWHKDYEDFVQPKKVKLSGPVANKDDNWFYMGKPDSSDSE